MKLKILRYKTFEKHAELVRNGKFDIARRLYRFLRDGSITLCLSDVDWAVDQILEDIGYKQFHSGLYNVKYNINRAA